MVSVELQLVDDPPPELELVFGRRDLGVDPLAQRMLDLARLAACARCPVAAPSLAHAAEGILRVELVFLGGHGRDRGWIHPRGVPTNTVGEP